MFYRTIGAAEFANGTKFHIVAGYTIQPSQGVVTKQVTVYNSVTESPVAHCGTPEAAWRALKYAGSVSPKTHRTVE